MEKRWCFWWRLLLLLLLFLTSVVVWASSLARKYFFLVSDFLLLLHFTWKLKYCFFTMGKGQKCALKGGITMYFLCKKVQFPDKNRLNCLPIHSLQIAAYSHRRKSAFLWVFPYFKSILLHNFHSSQVKYTNNDDVILRKINRTGIMGGSSKTYEYTSSTGTLLCIFHGVCLI